MFEYTNDEYQKRTTLYLSISCSLLYRWHCPIYFVTVSRLILKLLPVLLTEYNSVRETCACSLNLCLHSSTVIVRTNFASVCQKMPYLSLWELHGMYVIVYENNFASERPWGSWNFFSSRHFVVDRLTKRWFQPFLSHR